MSNFPTFSLSFKIEQVLHILKYFTFGFFPFHNSYGVFFVPSLKYTLFTMWHVVFIALTHKFLATSLLCIIFLAFSWMSLFFLLTTPFCWGAIGAENSWAMPTSIQKCFNWEFSDSLPWLLWSLQSLLSCSVIFYERSLFFGEL